ncbi:MAG: hypothetical protein IJX74_06315 [Clostridia bacterium]|nr:hypothetical protein [Clostridia bacterium]
MYGKIGKTIKSLAAVIAVLEVLVAVVAGVVCMFGGSTGIITGIVIIVLGTVLAWISFVMIYGFGELIDIAAKIEYNTSSYEDKATCEQADKVSDKNSKYAEAERLREEGVISEEDYKKQEAFERLFGNKS